MKTFLTIFNAFPAILQSVVAVEAAIPLSQAGQQKMSLILNAAAAAWTVGQIGEQAFSKATTVAAVQSMANVAVAGLNSAGVFTQSPAAPAAPVSSK